MMLDDAHNNLTKAINLADLPAIIKDFYPDSGAVAGKEGRIKAVWREGDGKSVKLKKDEKDGFWTYKDFGGSAQDNDAHNAWTFLVEIAGYSKADAAAYLLEHAGFPSERKSPKPTPKRTQPSKVKSKATAKPESTVKRDLKTWHKLPTTGTSAYLLSKGVADVPCDAIRFGNGYASALIQAFRDDGTLEHRGVQKLLDRRLPSGTNKLFSKGLAKKGGFIVLGNVADLSGGAVICEGLATGLTIKQAGARLVICALDAGNIMPVVESIRTFYPDAPLTIASDNDQKTKGNPGYDAALEASLVFDCSLAVPNFTLASGQGTDFNDLAAAAGLDVVRRQLRAARKPNPKHLPPLRLDSGTFTIKAPHGVGKTYQIQQNVARWQSEGKSVLYLTHSAALAKSAGRLLGLDCYEDFKGGGVPSDLMRASDYLATCVNSLTWLIGSNGVKSFDVVIWDESEQGVDALGGSHIAFKSKVMKALTSIVKGADTVVTADADAGALTQTMLELWRPDEAIQKIEHRYPVGAGRFVNLCASVGDLYKAVLTSQVPTFTVTNSKNQADIITALLEHFGKTVKKITGETSANEQDFLTDIEKNAQREGIQHVVCSPSVRTGNDLSGGYFQRVCGVFSHRVGKPESALQALWRVRTEVEYHLWIDPTKRHDFVNIDAKYGDTQAYEDSLTGGKLDKLERFADYTVLRMLSERLTQQAQRDFKGGLLELMTAQGFTFNTLEHDPTTKHLVKQGRELVKTARHDAIEFDESHESTREAIQEFYRLTEADTLRLWIEKDNFGQYRKQIQRLEHATTNTLDAFIDETLERVDMRDDMPNLASEREFYSKVLEAVGLRAVVSLWQKGVLEQLDLPRYSKDTLEPLRQWIESNREWLSGLMALPKADKLQANIVRYVGTWLKRLGLKQARVGKNAGGQYALEVATVESACETMKRRGTLFVETEVLEKSVPTLPEVASSPPLDPLAVFQRALEQGVLTVKASSLAKIREWLATGNRTMLQKAYEAMPKDMKAMTI